MKTLLFLLIAGFASAQMAEVYELTPTESQEGERLYQSMKQAEAAYSAYSDRMAQKYLKQDNCITQGGVPCYHGIFSVGHKHIVPKPETTNANRLGLPYYGIAN